MKNDFELNVERFCQLMAKEGINIKQKGKNSFVLNKVIFTVKHDQITSNMGFSGRFFSIFGLMKQLRKAKAFDAYYTIDRKLDSAYNQDDNSPIQQWIKTAKPWWSLPGYETPVK